MFYFSVPSHVLGERVCWPFRSRKPIRVYPSRYGGLSRFPVGFAYAAGLPVYALKGGHSYEGREFILVQCAQLWYLCQQRQ